MYTCERVFYEYRLDVLIIIGMHRKHKTSFTWGKIVCLFIWQFFFYFFYRSPGGPSQIRIDHFLYYVFDDYYCFIVYTYLQKPKRTNVQPYYIIKHVLPRRWSEGQKIAIIRPGAIVVWHLYSIRIQETISYKWTLATTRPASKTLLPLLLF